MDSYIYNNEKWNFFLDVLILIVMEDALVQKIIIMKKADFSLNPYCSGRWSHTANAFTVSTSVSLVLILVVVDYGLVQCLIN